MQVFINRIKNSILNIFNQDNALFDKNHLDQLFNHRNKSYGAYLLRQHYRRNLCFAYGMAIGIFILTLMIYTKCSKEEQVDMEYLTEIFLTPPPEIILPKLQPKTTANNFKSAPIKKKISQDQIKVVEDQKEIADTNNKNEIPPVQQDSSMAQQDLGSNGNNEGDEEPVFQFADIMPQFPGGPKALSGYISSKLLYPRDAVQQRIEGTVLVGFIVDQYGKVRKPYIVESLIPICDEEALRVTRSIPDWIPAKSKGRNVSVHFRIPIEFKLKRY